MAFRERAKSEKLVKDILEYIGEDPDREGLIETPKRYLKFLKDFTKSEKFNFTTFKNETDEMVLVKDINFSSLCEHHLLPFFGKAHIAYIPNRKMAGISKLPRTLNYFSSSLQNQERLTNQVANFLMEKLEPMGVGVVLTAQHTCMIIRGVKKIDSWTTTSSMKGVFLTNQSCREEFLNLIK